MISKKTVEDLRKFLETATPSPWEMHSNAGYCGIMAGKEGLFLSDNAMFADGRLICLLRDTSSLVLDEIEKLVDADYKEGVEEDEEQHTHCPYWEKKLHEKDVESYKKEIDALKKENVELKNKMGKIKELF